MSISPKLQLQQLIVLQSLDDEIVDHRKLLADIPLQIDVRCAELKEKEKILSNAKEELEAAKALAEHYEAKQITLALPVLSSTTSSLVNSKLKVPKKRFNSDTI